MGQDDTQWQEFQVEPLEPRAQGRSGGGRDTRPLLFGGLAAVLVVALIATSLAVAAAMRSPGGRGGGGTTAGGTATPDATPQATVTEVPTATPPNAPFICANPAGSTRMYVFRNADHQLYRVTGCSTPVRLTHLDASTQMAALAFSPSNRWLMTNVGPTTQPERGGPPTCQTLMNPQTGALTTTKYCEDMSLAPAYPIDRFIAWQDDSTFLEAEFQQPINNTTPVKILRVNVASLAPTTVTTITWLANMAISSSETGILLRGGYLYYGGYMSASEGGAWLHRVSLATGADTKLVGLGVAGFGPCQVYEGPCNWTGPWDISGDGTRIVYHNPGPTTTPSDTGAPPETPLYIANPDGSAALKLTSPPGGTNSRLSAPSLAPSGAWVTAPDVSGKLVLLATNGSGASIALPSPSEYPFIGWQSDSKSILLYRQGPNYTQANAIFTLATKSVLKLADYIWNYVWGA
jgi:hypothetical protein